MAGIIPGIMTIILYCVTIYLMVKINPSLAPEVPSQVTWRQKGQDTLANLPVLFIALIVSGGIYLGWFTPTESAAVGAFMVAVVAIIASRGYGLKGIGRSFLLGARNMGMLIFLLIAGYTLFRFVVVSQVGDVGSEFIASLGLSPYLLVVCVFIFFLLWGCFVGTSGMILIAIPVLLPMLTASGWDPIWFGVFSIKALEIASVTPPIGMNVFVVEGIVQDKDIQASAIFKYIIPFCIADTLVIVIMTAFPQVCLWLPSTMG
jgi:tripartite ATP-independent transporter DctM subunit